MMGGYTEGRKLSALCELNHVQVAPHHDCFIHATSWPRAPRAASSSRSPTPSATRSRPSSSRTRRRSRDGTLTLKEAPGLGLTLSEKAVKKFGERIV